MSKKTKLAFVTILTFVRFPLVLLFFAGAIAYVKHPLTWLFFTGFGCMIASAITDLFDGYFARKFKVVTQLGAHADPLMDKFFYLATFPLLVYVSALNGNIRHATILLILTMLFLTRDQWVTFLRSIGAIYNVSGGAAFAGKLRTSITFPLICVVYYFEEAPEKYQFINDIALYTFEAVALIINTASVYIYTKRYWPYLIKATDLEEND